MCVYQIYKINTSWHRIRMPICALKHDPMDGGSTLRSSNKVAILLRHWSTNQHESRLFLFSLKPHAHSYVIHASMSITHIQVSTSQGHQARRIVSIGSPPLDTLRSPPVKGSTGQEHCPATP